MDDALTVHRLHFAFTITYHYLFPQLTMGLALLILILKTMALRTGNEHYNRAVRFWAKIFGINFALGVVTGIPMEFQFGTNWAAFSKAAGGVIGQTLAMEGVFSFFLESSFLGLLLFGEKRLGPRGHWFAALMVFIGSWLSGYLIIATNAWMQHPVGYTLGPQGEILLSDFWALLLNPWALWQYAHNMNGAVLTGCFVMASVGAFYLLSHKYEEYGRTFVRIAVIVGVVSSVLQIFPTGDAQGRMVALHQPVTLAAMEGRFLGLPAIAVSLAGKAGAHFETAAHVTLRLLEKLKRESLPADTILNVNVPDVPVERIAGFEATRLGHRHKAEPVIRTNDPHGNPVYWVGAPGAEADAGPGTDFHAIRQHFVSITPLHVDLTRYTALDQVSAWLRKI